MTTTGEQQKMRGAGGSAGAAAAQRRRRSSSGASLIEILVVLVIILIGLFAIIRVFPTGLGTLRTTGDRTLAAQLANQQNGLLKSDPAGLPMGVFVGYYDSASNRVLDPTVDPDDLRPYNPSAAVGAGGANAAENPYFSDVNRARFIEGEAIKVPGGVSAVARLGGSGVPVTAGVAVLKFGPIFIDRDNGGLASAGQSDIADSYLRVYGAPLQSITAPYVAETASVSLDNSYRVAGYLRGPQTYLIDDNASGVAPRAHVLFPSSMYGKKFLISYSYSDGTTVHYVDKTPIVAGKQIDGTTDVGPNAATTPYWQEIPCPGVGAAPNVVAGSDRVFRIFTRLPVTASGISWSEDPYEYALLDDNFSDTANNSLTFANLGRIGFNPRGAAYGSRSAYGQQAFTAYVDYSVLDWHILRDDREVPTAIPGLNNTLIVRTTVPNIKQAGTSVNFDNTLYEGMFGQNTADLMVVNLADGRVLDGGDYNLGQSPDPTKDYWIDGANGGGYSTGTIYVNSLRVPAGAHLRLLYKADGDWAVALQKAYSQYQLLDANPASPTGFPAVNNPRAFSLGPGTAPVLHFNNSEFNKSVVVRFQYVKTDGSVVQTAPVQITLDDTPVTAGAYQFATKDVTAYMPGRDTAQSWSLVGNIATGVSVKTRVIYRDANSNAAGGSSTQGAAVATDPSAGWRIQDIDTYLTPAPAQP